MAVDQGRDHDRQSGREPRQLRLGRGGDGHGVGAQALEHRRARLVGDRELLAGIEPDASIGDMGVDSLTAIELGIHLRRSLGVDFTKQIFGRPEPLLIAAGSAVNSPGVPLIAPSAGRLPSAAVAE